MNKPEFLHNLEDLVEVDPGTLTEQMMLDEIPGWDSMAIMSFLAFADEELGGAPAPKAIKGCQTIGDLMALSGL
jgi:acyl carrier protein